MNNLIVNMCAYVNERLLILAKTYPIPSGNYIETTCVAAVTQSGLMRRLYPIPFRLLEREAQFKKWEWITAEIERASSDKRPESHRVNVDSIQRQDSVSTRQAWTERRDLINPCIAASFADLDDRRQKIGASLGILHVSRLLKLKIEESDEPEWTDKRKLQLAQQGLFHNEDIKNRPLLRKLPYDFYYRYEIDTPLGIESLRHKITDWEVGALYWNCIKKYGRNGWELKLRARLEDEFKFKDLHLLLGTMHRFQNQWLIIGLIYPPKRDEGLASQPRLDLGL